MQANHVFWWLMLFYIHLLVLLLQPSVLWLSIVTFNNDAKPAPKWILPEFDVSQIPPQLGGLPHLETFTWQNVTPAERVTDWLPLGLQGCRFTIPEEKWKLLVVYVAVWSKKKISVFKNDIYKGTIWHRIRISWSGDRKGQSWRKMVMLTPDRSTTFPRQKQQRIIILWRNILSLRKHPFLLALRR